MNLQKQEHIRESLKTKKRIVIKIGTSSITHEASGALNLTKLEILVRELCDLKNQGKEIILVSSGAIAVGRQAVHLSHRPTEISEKQACAAIGQAQLMMIYQKLFHEYGHLAAQILLTKDNIGDATGKENALNTFEELLEMGVIPIVNENDTISTYEIQFGDNDRLSAIVASMVHAELLILLSDIDGLFTDDPNKNPDARFIPLVSELNAHLMKMGKGTRSNVGTGGMEAKLRAAQIATQSGADMIIANGADFHIIHKILDGKEYGTLFCAQEQADRFLDL